MFEMCNIVMWKIMVGIFQRKVLFVFLQNPQVTEIPADVKAFLLAEISRYNPMYPVRRVFRHLTRGCQAKRDRQSETTGT